MNLTISAASTAMYATWVFVDEFSLLFDVGDGISAALLQKSKKIRNIFISHADRDHLCGLPQFCQLNAENGWPRIHYPSGCRSFPALEEFMKRFDPQSGPATWIPLEEGSVVEIGKGCSVTAYPCRHVVEEGKTKALSYSLRRSKRVLKAEFRGLPGPEIAELRKSQGEDHISEIKYERLLGYSGDTPDFDRSYWASHQVLFHESTFLRMDEVKHAHSGLPKVMEESSGLPLQALVLYHFSARYSEEEIIQAIRNEAERCRPQFLVYAVLPGAVCRDVLRQEPVWKPV